MFKSFDPQSQKKIILAIGRDTLRWGTAMFRISIESAIFLVSFNPDLVSLLHLHRPYLVGLLLWLSWLISHKPNETANLANALIAKAI
jgi:hypothetical protein